MTSLLTCIQTLSTQTTGLKILPSNPLSSFSSTFNKPPTSVKITTMLRAQPTQNAKVTGTKIAKNTGRSVTSKSFNSSVLLEDVPYVEDDAVGLINGIIEVGDIDLFEERMNNNKNENKKNKKAWTGEIEVLKEYQYITPTDLCKCLKTVDLSQMKISSIDEHSHTLLSNLRSLNLSSNKLTEMGNFSPSLLTLALPNNQITTIENTNQLPELMQLSLSHNKITDLPSTLQTFYPSLLSLDLSYNSLNDINNVISSLKLLSTVQHLYLQGNPIALLPLYRAKILSSLANVTYFDGKDVADDDVTLSDYHDALESVDGLNGEDLEKCWVKVKVCNVKNLPVFTSQVNSEVKKEVAVKGKGKKEDKKVPEVASEVSTNDSTEMCYLQIKLCEHADSFKSPSVKYGEQLWCDKAEIIDEPTVAKSTPKGAKRASMKAPAPEIIPVPVVKPEKNEAVVDVCCDVNEVFRDCVLFKLIEVRLFVERVTVVHDDFSDDAVTEEGNVGLEMITSTDTSITTVTTVYTQSPTTESNTTPASTQKRSVTSKRVSEAAFGTIDVSRFLSEDSVFDVFGSMKFNLDGKLKVNQGYVNEEKERVKVVSSEGSEGEIKEEVIFFVKDISFDCEVGINDKGMFVKEGCELDREKGPEVEINLESK